VYDRAGTTLYDMRAVLLVPYHTILLYGYGAMEAELMILRGGSLLYIARRYGGRGAQHDLLTCIFRLGGLCLVCGRRKRYAERKGYLTSYPNYLLFCMLFESRERRHYGTTPVGSSGAVPFLPPDQRVRGPGLCLPQGGGGFG
jgi:hypothetical protein